MIFFWIFWCIDAAIALTVLYFFGEGLADNTISGSNIGLWLVLLLIPAVIMGLGYILKSNNELMWAKVVVSLMAIPGLLFGIFALYLGNQNWQ
ncbi:osmoprotectant transporter permease [Dyadobacter sp. LHD-138]|uniref:osmoprotectant transporter permease n=1 Tax=Dyadobacter sp. LHD-138 TaxID=3071413 RepID=UPI0027E170FC|nr:osmoprotectant transporter permease [Dyadobacter sp. LHD-138]MDQ6478227.1 osmoprotectant transporter permease [Dyadobacter sp. LHD-138]